MGKYLDIIASFDRRKRQDTTESQARDISALSDKSQLLPVAEAVSLRPNSAEKATKVQTVGNATRDISDETADATLGGTYTTTFVATLVAPEVPEDGSVSGFCRLNRFCRTPGSLAQAFDDLERRRPDYVDDVRWQAAIRDGRRFLDQWGEQAEALGWTAQDVFGLHTPPEQPDPSYQRLSRRDAIGLVWLLQGCSVILVTANAATIVTGTGAILTFKATRLQ